MSNLRFLPVVLALGCVISAPAGVYAQRNIVKIWRQTQKTVSSLEKQTFKELKRLQRTRTAGITRTAKITLVAPGAGKKVRVEKPSVSAALPSPLALPEIPLLPEVSPLAPVRSVLPGKERVDAVIFDLDGTLLDSLSAWENSGVNFLRTQGIEPPEGLQEELVKMSLMDGARLVKERFSLPQEPEEILRLTLEPIRRRYFEDIAAKPGVPETLRRLKAQGVKLCIATASDGELARAALERLELLDLFDFIVTCDEVGVGKRQPAVYEEALRRLGTQKSRTLVAEDAPYALETARRAGFVTAGVADSHTPQAGAAYMRQQADFYIEDFSSPPAP